ncbi:hypothetical protein KEM09_14660 [Carboxylicivirga mesophila]|uniref:Uncharacterized protein n=1 Tax=Carboxylicivirga mesophila TaxID=1166478 RepID=A0ABS5KCW0_9BACT|nr:hypothetical protein [Carboxylicivirga mesophila]MBS2212657.1 hypothetical protein [Carboxylicivirga mesophila]
MKLTIMVFGLIQVLMIESYGQLKYEGTIDSDYKTVTLEDGSVKYVIYNKREQTVNLHNVDKTLWKSINLSLPRHHFLDEIKHISLHTLNKDDLLEIIYSCTVLASHDDIDTPEDEFRKIDSTINVINEQGAVLLKVPNSNDIKLIDTGGKKKLLVYRHSSERIGHGDETLVYSF